MLINLSRKASSSDWSFSIDPFSIETFLRMSVGHQVGEVGGLQAWAATNSDTWIGPVTRWQFKAVSKINIHQIFQHMYLFTCHCQSMSITSKKANFALWLVVLTSWQKEPALSSSFRTFHIFSLSFGLPTTSLADSYPIFSPFLVPLALFFRPKWLF